MESIRVTYDASAPTEHQLVLAERLQRVLDGRVRCDRVLAPATGNGPSVDFVLRTRKPGLSVRLVLYQDSFHVSANDAEATIELVEPDRYEAWADYVVAVTSQLLSQPLRIRVRYPFFRWFPRESAIYLSDGHTGGWNGDLSVGKGSESVFDDWYEPARPS